MCPAMPAPAENVRPAPPECPVELVTEEPVAAALIVAIVNPLWFRSAMFDWVERGVNRLSQWRNYQKYRIYLGTDPKMWHTLRGDLK